ELLASLVYDAALFDPATAERMARQLAVLLASLAGEPERRVLELALLSPAERFQLLVEWNDTATAAPAPAGTVAELFAARAAARPGAPALLWGEGEVSYGALAARAGWIARRLTASGVGPEDRVGVLLPRTPDLAAALLGVLAA